MVEAGKGSPMRGTEMFRQMLAHFGSYVKGIRGAWHYGDNLAECNRLTAQGMSVVDAAKLTWTGKRAAEAGFKGVRVIETVGEPGKYTRVIVVFE